MIEVNNMTKYHISPESGRPNICRAEKQDCPVGGSHFDNKVEAKAYAENKLSEEHGGSFGNLSKNSKKEDEDYQDGADHAKDGLRGGLDPNGLLANVSQKDSFDYGPFCFVCKRPVEHIGEHEALVNAGMAEYDDESGVVRKTKSYDSAKAQKIQKEEAEYLNNNPVDYDAIMNSTPPNKNVDHKEVVFGAKYGVSEKVDALKEFSKTNEYKKIMKDMGYAKPEDSMAHKVMNGSYPIAVRSATKKLEGNKKAGMKEYIRQLEEDAYEEEMSNISRGYTDTPIYSSSSSNYDNDVKLLDDDEILSGDFNFDDEDDSGIDFSEDDE